MSQNEFEAILSDSVRHLEKLVGVELSKSRIDSALKEATHIIIHELAHTALEQALPWLGNLEERQRVLVDDVLARFLERKVSAQLHLFTESPEEQLKEMRGYSLLQDLDWSLDFYHQLYEEFEKHIRHGGNVEAFAHKILEYYQEHGARDH